MDIQITVRHTKASDSLKDKITEKLQKMEKFNEKITAAHVILDAEHTEKSCELLLNAQNQRLSAKGKGDNVGKAVDDAITKIERQIKKITEKVKNHKSPSPKEQL